jgi:hypothetical protein
MPEDTTELRQVLVDKRRPELEAINCKEEENITCVPLHPPFGGLTYDAKDSS